MNKNGSKNYKVFDEKTIEEFENRYDVQYKNPFIIVNVKDKEIYRAYNVQKMFRKVREILSEFFQPGALESLIIRCNTNVHRYVLTKLLR